MAEGKVYAVGSGAHWDERRNSSQVRAVPADALPNALRALRAGRNEPWYQWIVNRQNGLHDHQALRSNGKPAACPVRGCDAVSG